MKYLLNPDLWIIFPVIISHRNVYESITDFSDWESNKAERNEQPIL
jgi:hypothetical protein